jgi:hypothetical protein
MTRQFVDASALPSSARTGRSMAVKDVDANPGVPGSGRLV